MYEFVFQLIRDTYKRLQEIYMQFKRHNFTRRRVNEFAKLLITACQVHFIKTKIQSTSLIITTPGNKNYFCSLLLTNSILFWEYRIKKVFKEEFYHMLSLLLLQLCVKRNIHHYNKNQILVSSSLAIPAFTWFQLIEYDSSIFHSYH